MKRPTAFATPIVALALCSLLWLSSLASALAATVTDTFPLKLTGTERCRNDPKFVEPIKVKATDGMTITLTRDVLNTGDLTAIQAKIKNSGNATIDAITLNGKALPVNKVGSTTKFVLSGRDPGNSDHFMTLRGTATFDKAGKLTNVTGTYVYQVLSDSGGVPNVDCFGSGTFATGKKLPPPGYVYPLTVGPTSRYLVDQNGKPFLLVGDTAWSLFVGVSKSDADVYLENRKQLGFTAVLASLIEHQFAANPPANFDNVTPFTGQAFTTTPNDAYFAHVDYVVQSAAAKGIVVLLAPLYLGYGCGSEGWCAEVQAATTSQMMAWGQYVGNRYKNFDNIVWVIGGDTDPSPVQAKVQAMVDGILSADSRHLFTAHNAPEQMAVTPWSGAGWLNVNNVYTYSGIAYQAIRSAYSTSPPMPVFLVEAAYENEHAVTNQELRAQSYWSVLSGGFGHVFGNCPIWGFGFASGFCASTNWQAQLNSVGSLNMQHFEALFNSRHWQTLVPDTSQAILTAGSGSFGDPNYAQAACAADGSSILAYLPSSRTVTVSGACLAGNTMTAWWYDPSNGVATQIGTGPYPTTGTQNFTPPSNGDWVLVLDSTNFSFPSPGQ